MISYHLFISFFLNNFEKYEIKFSGWKLKLKVDFELKLIRKTMLVRLLNLPKQQVPFLFLFFLNMKIKVRNCNIDCLTFAKDSEVETFEGCCFSECTYQETRNSIECQEPL